MSPKVSIIIRTKNEERWIVPCLDAIYKQSYQDFEIVLVDNESTDKTVEKVRQFPVRKVLSIEKYLPGKSLNTGIEQADGDYIVCISAHCVPTNERWLEKLVNALEEDENYAGVYGRQEPLSFSPPADKRDLLLVFGLDRKIQKKDSFFHNANSIFRKKLWEEVPFDSEITNIEDRIWAKQMLQRGHSILYEPEASVYHYHGIHQGGNEERLKNVVKIIEEGNSGYVSGRLNPKNLNVIALIPVKGRTRQLGDKPQIAYTIEAAKASQYIGKIFVSTDSRYTAEIAQKFGANCPFLRPSYLSEDHVNLHMVQKYSLEQIEILGELPDLVVHLEETFPFRKPNMLDEMIRLLVHDGYDSVIASRSEPGWIWREESAGSFERIDIGDVPRMFKEKALVGLHGLACVTHPQYIRDENMLGKRTGLYEVNYPFANIEIRDDVTAHLAINAINQFFH